MTKQITTLGFSEYEARAYICLLKVQPATAYEISRESGIPSSKIYEIIARLVDKHIFMMAQADEGAKKKYIAVPPGEFINSRRSAFTKTFEVLEEELPKINKAPQVSCIWNVSEYELLMNKAQRMIAESMDTILLSAWETELETLSNALIEAENRGVKIATVHYGDTQCTSGQLFSHPIEDTIYDEKGGRGFVLVCDSNVAIVGTVNDQQGAEGAWSSNQGFITLAEDYIKHDIYIMKIVSRFDDTLIGKFGHNYKHLRNIFEDKDLS